MLTKQSLQTIVCRHWTRPYGKESKAAANMGLNEMAGEVLNQTVVLSIYICAGRQVSAFKPPLR